MFEAQKEMVYHKLHAGINHKAFFGFDWGNWATPAHELFWDLGWGYLKQAVKETMVYHMMHFYAGQPKSTLKLEEV